MRLAHVGVSEQVRARKRLPSISSAFLRPGMASYRRSNSARLSWSPVSSGKDFLASILRLGWIGRCCHCRNRLSLLGQAGISEVGAIGNRSRRGLLQPLITELYPSLSPPIKDIRLPALRLNRAEEKTCWPGLTLGKPWRRQRCLLNFGLDHLMVMTPGWFLGYPDTVHEGSCFVRGVAAEWAPILVPCWHEIGRFRHHSLEVESMSF